MLPERFTSKFIITEDDHWLWIAAKITTGYGRFWSKDCGRVVSAHRYSWENLVGPIPDGMNVLHKNSCHRRDCVNPDHLYLGTLKQNMQDSIEIGTAWMGKHESVKTHCPHGHEYTEENTYICGTKRQCKTCTKERDKLRYDKIRKRGCIMNKKF